MPGTETASASTPTVVSATTAATPNSTSGALSRRPSRALLSQHSSISGLAFPNRSSPPNSLSRFPTVSSLASARDGALDSTAAAAVAGHQMKTFQERRRGSQQDLYSSLLRPDRSRSVSPSAAAPLSQRRLLSRSSSSSSSSHDTHVRPLPTPVVAAAAAVPPGVSVQPRSPPASRLQPFRSSSSRSSLSIGSSPVQQRPLPQHSSSGDGNVSTMVSATTAGQSSITNIAVSQREEGEGGAERHRHLTAGSRNLSINTSNSVALTLLAGPPPPSGLRDPVTLLQLLPVDLLLQSTTESPLGPSSGTLKWSGKQQQYSTVERRERGRQTPTTPATAASAASSLACDYRRAFSLLRCAKQPVASLHSSLAWQAGDGSDSLEATLGSVMMELMHRSNAAGAPLASHQTFSPAPRTSAAYAHLKDQQNRASCGGGAGDGEETVPLCSLAAAALGEASAGRDDADIDDDDDIAATEAGVVPLICFAATVECPPDIRRCLLLSRTHAYLCDLDGTIAYCAAIHDVRQVVTCAGGYMVWRFVPDALVRTMYTVNTGEERRRAGEALATSTGGGARSSRPSNPTSLLAAQRVSGSNAAASASSVEAPATVWGMRDEMSDWVFRILSVGATSPPTPATATAAAATTGIVSAASPMESGGVGDAAPLPAASPRDDGLAEERMSAMVFLIEVMCTLRTLPRLLMDAVVAGSAATPSTSASGSEEGFSQPQHYSSSDAQRIRLRSARSQSTDQLDRMHVPGDRPARVPLLLEGAVGHQTAVKFVEHYWTTRYDQLPPLLRPRRLLAAGAGPSAPSASPSAVEGGRGARVRRVASSLHIPAIPVAALSACLGAEESVTSMLETARTAARASLTEDRSRRGRGEASSPLTPATAASPTHALSLKDMRSPAAQADAQATLSPAAWRILQSMLRPDDSTETSAPSQRTLHAAHHFVPATGLTTPTTPNAAQTRAHSEDGPSLSSRSSASSSSSGAAAGGATSPTSSSAEAEVTRDTAVSCDAASQPVRAERGEEKAEAAPSHPLCNDLICAAAESQSADACLSIEVGTTYSEKDDEAPAATAADAERDLAPLSAVHEEPQRLSRARDETSVKGECLSAKDNSLTTKSSSSSTTTTRSRHEEVRQEEPVSVSSSRSAVSASARRAITAARLRRQRRAGTEEQTDDAVAAVTAQHTSRADERLSSPSTDAATEKKSDSAMADVLSLRVAPAPPDVSVEAFERRVAHRPARDRLVLRARFIQQLLQPPLLSSANVVSHKGHSERQTDSSHAGSYQDATCSLSDVDADCLVEDLRRQRMIAELMLLQQREDAVLKAATAAAANTAAGGPSRDEVGGPRWLATALQERVQRNSRPDSYD